MIPTNGARQKRHDAMVEYVTDYLKQRFYRNIRADLSGFPKPGKIATRENGTLVPDVTLVSRGDKFHIVEVETDDSIFDPHTEPQWKTFAEYARQSDSQFWLVVPKGSRPDAERRLDELQLSARVWEV